MCVFQVRCLISPVRQSGNKCSEVSEVSREFYFKFGELYWMFRVDTRSKLGGKVESK